MTDAQWVGATLAVIVLVVVASLLLTLVRPKSRGALRHPTDDLSSDSQIDLERSRAANKYPL